MILVRHADALYQESHRPFHFYFAGIRTACSLKMGLVSQLVAFPSPENEIVLSSSSRMMSRYSYSQVKRAPLPTVSPGDW